jgi:hypothetical protein
MESRTLLVTALAACLLAHVAAQPQLPSTVTDFVITPAQPVARQPWTIQFEYTPSGPGAAAVCNRLTTIIEHTSSEQLKACTPSESYTRVTNRGKACLVTVHCGSEGDTVGGLQSLQAVVQLEARGNMPAETLETFTIANAPNTNSLVGCGCCTVSTL